MVSETYTEALAAQTDGQAASISATNAITHAEDTFNPLLLHDERQKPGTKAFASRPGSSQTIYELDADQTTCIMRVVSFISCLTYLAFCSWFDSDVSQTLAA
jgi:hypothetical protein